MKLIVAAGWLKLADRAENGFGGGYSPLAGINQALNTATAGYNVGYVQFNAMAAIIWLPKPLKIHGGSAGYYY